MVIWKGSGWLVFIIGAASFLLTQLAVDGIVGPDAYTSSAWPKVVGGLVAGIVVWPVGRYFNSKEGRTLIDEKTGERISFKETHSLFFIPIWYWGIIFPILGLLAGFLPE